MKTLALLLVILSTVAFAETAFKPTVPQDNPHCCWVNVNGSVFYICGAATMCTLAVPGRPHEPLQLKESLFQTEPQAASKLKVNAGIIAKK